MKFNESWLREWVNPAITTDKLVEQITMAGLEVDDIVPVSGDFDHVKVGYVVECDQHPDADKLRVTKVDVGENELLDIVCGAPNCRQGLKVAVALVGASLPGNFKIKKAKLRGQISNGMLCSYSELGINIDLDGGIIELPADAPIGTLVREYLSLDDQTIDIDLTPNRADCFSVRGIAREVGVLNSLDLTLPSFNVATNTISDQLNINVQEAAACPRYLGRIIKNIDVKVQTPLWIKEKLRRCGVRSIDPVVDITNYVLLEQGHPLHAFDLDSISGGIVIRMAKQDETLVLLDDNEVKLKSDTLVIADHKKALAIAGIFGGRISGVSSNTKNIVLESAFFTPSYIRGRARDYGLHTDASMRYERGVDHALQHYAMERATQLIVEICGGKVAPIVAVESIADLPSTPKITLTRKKLDQLLGHHIIDEQVSEILTRLGITIVESQAGKYWQVTVPTWRFDLNIEEDLIEEVARIYGYNNIVNQMPIATLEIIANKESNLSLSKVRDLLINRGYNQAITYSFVDPKLQQAIVPYLNAITLPDPISSEMSQMRLGLIQGLLTSLVYNQKRQQTRIKLFEHGLRFINKDPSSSQLTANNILQEEMLAGVITGSRFAESWLHKNTVVDFFDLKGDVEAIFNLTNKEESFCFRSFSIGEKQKYVAFHPEQAAVIMLDDAVVGVIGTIHPSLLKTLGLINSNVIAFEVKWSAIANREIAKVSAISKYPANRRDIALIVDEAVVVGDILTMCKQVGSKLLQSAVLFDVYRGAAIGENKKSLAIALTVQSLEKTLEDADINNVVEHVVDALITQFNAKLRD